MLLCTWIGLIYAVISVSSIDTSTSWDYSYDYIVVGAGTAGSVVARRLSDDPEISVLLLEAGDDSDEPFLPSLKTFVDTHRSQSIDWGFVSNTHPDQQGKMEHWYQGRALGGSSAVNAHLYTRGSPHDYDRWEELGNKGWSYKDVFPYFLKSEDMQEPSLANNGYHGVGGLIRTTVHSKNPVVDTFIKAAVEMGHNHTEDYHAGTYEGFAPIQQMTSRRGGRMSLFDSYIRPVLGRYNLHILEKAFATKIKINMETKEVKGVYFVKDEKEHFVHARNEVIVCGGAINSPKLLMLSGIGPAQELSRMGIEVVADLPVGKNLQDQCVVPIPLTIDKSSPLHIEKSHTYEALFKFIFDSSGPWTRHANTAIGFYRAASQPAQDKFTFIEYMYSQPFLTLPQELVESVRNGSGVVPHLLEALQRSEDGHRTLLAQTVHLHPKARGTVALNDTNPFINPIITYNFMEHKEDIAIMVEGLKNVKKLVDTDTMQKVKVHPLTADSNCLDYEFDSDEYWECYVRQYHESFIHFCCSNKMAPDESGVLDERLRVKGINGLRVADSSSMPMITSGHTMAPTVMIAEKCADMIKEDVKLTKDRPKRGDHEKQQKKNTEL